MTRFNKHPPMSAFFVEVFYQVFGSQDWAYYFLSQIFVIFAFYIVYKFSEDFFQDKIYAFISVLLLEGVYFYNFTTPEFNVNVCQLPFWALSVLYCWRGLKDDKISEILIDPNNLEINADNFNSLLGDHAKFNANKMIDIFKGEDNDFSKAVCLNAAAGLVVAEKFVDFKDAYKNTREYILSGKSFKHLEKIQNV